MSYREFLQQNQAQSWNSSEKEALVARLSQTSSVTPPAPRDYNEWSLAEISAYFETGKRPGPAITDQPMDDDEPPGESALLECLEAELAELKREKEELQAAFKKAEHRMDRAEQRARAAQATARCREECVV